MGIFYHLLTPSYHSECEENFSWWKQQTELKILGEKKETLFGNF